MTEILLVALSGLLLLLILLLPSLVTSKSRSGQTIDKQFVQQQWQQIESMVQQPDERRRYAVIEADKLLDYVLKQRGYAGETMGERLKSAGKDFSFVDDVWSAHKLRNKLVHEADYELDQRLARKAVEQLQSGLKDMGVL